MPRRYLQPQQHAAPSARHDNDGRFDDDDDSSTTYAARHTCEPAEQGPVRRASTTATTHDLRAWLGHSLGWRKSKRAQITTAPGQLGAGETETEADEPPRHLPTARILPAPEPLVPQNTLATLLFEVSRLLSVVPALLGASINAWCLLSPPGHTTVLYRRPQCAETWGRKTLPDRGDYFLAVLWALLTAHQCLELTTGLLHRWRAYYHPLSTLIRLLALQAICWPATHFTLDILGSWGANVPLHHEVLGGLETTLLRWTTVRPDVCWAAIGTTTCFSRSIQIWVTSNLLPSPASTSGVALMPGAMLDRSRQRAKKGPGEDVRKPSGRRWDWGIVARVCVLPASLLYFLMAWVGAWRREDSIC